MHTSVRLHDLHPKVDGLYASRWHCSVPALILTHVYRAMLAGSLQPARLHALHTQLSAVSAAQTCARVRDQGAAGGCYIELMPTALSCLAAQTWAQVGSNLQHCLAYIMKRVPTTQQIECPMVPPSHGHGRRMYAHRVRSSACLQVAETQNEQICKPQLECIQVSILVRFRSAQWHKCTYHRCMHYVVPNTFFSSPFQSYNA